MTKACIFCGEFREMTREHIWGHWIRDFVPLGPNLHHLRDVEVGARGEVMTATTVRKAGSALALNRRIVCKPCNNTWMSRLQERARPFLVPLLRGERCALGPEAQTAIAAWATMVTMTAEFMLESAGKVGVSREDRLRLMQTEAPILEWRIWAAYHRGGVYSHGWTHTSLPIVGGEDLPNAELVYSPLPNTQTTTFVVGELYIHTMSSAYHELCRDWQWLGNDRLRALLVPIWPIRHEFIAWPWHGITDNDIAMSAEMFTQHCERAVRGTGF